MCIMMSYEEKCKMEKLIMFKGHEVMMMDLKIKKLQVLFTSFQQVVAPAGLVLKVLKLKCRKFFLNLC